MASGGIPPPHLLYKSILQNVRFIDFRDLKAEWNYYSKWKATERNPPEAMSWMQYYLQKRTADVNDYLLAVGEIADIADDQPDVVQEMNRHRESGNLLKTVYNKGLDGRYPDPTDLESFILAIGPMTMATQSGGVLAALPTNKRQAEVTSKNTPRTPRRFPPVLRPKPGPPIATGLPLPLPTISWWEGMRRQYLKPHYIGAEEQLERAIARGWQEKNFASLFQYIPEAAADAGAGRLAEQERTNASTRGIRSRQDVQLDPYDINKELDDDPRPAQVDFTQFGYDSHPEDYDDEFFKKQYLMLYERTVDFADKWFGDIDLPDPGYNGSPWQEVFNDQFIEYSRLVAHEDRHVGGWPAFLRQAKYRKWLIVGILGQIMEKKIYTDLLFGATPAWKKELEQGDWKLIRVEGENSPGIPIHCFGAEF